MRGARSAAPRRRRTCPSPRAAPAPAGRTRDRVEPATAPRAGAIHVVFLELGCGNNKGWGGGLPYHHHVAYAFPKTEMPSNTNSHESVSVVSSFSCREGVADRGGVTRMRNAPPLGPASDHYGPIIHSSSPLSLLDPHTHTHTDLLRTSPTGTTGRSTGSVLPPAPPAPESGACHGVLRGGKLGRVWA